MYRSPRPSRSVSSAAVRLSWAGLDAPFVDARLAAESGAIRLAFSGETVTARTVDGVRSWAIPAAPAEKAGIVLQAACPREARSPLLVTEVVALTTSEKE